MDTKTRSLLYLLHILIIGCVVISAQTEASEPTPEPTSEPEGEAELSPEDVYDWMMNHKEYVAMIGMGIVIILLFITVIVILCCYTGGSSGRSDKYREKP